MTPKEYKLEAGEPIVTFNNFFTEYSRFHMDETNTIIHMLFIPVLVGTIMGIMQHCKPFYSYGLQINMTGESPTVEFGHFTDTVKNTFFGGHEGIVLINNGLLFWTMCGTFYIISDFIVGFIAYFGGIGLYALTLWLNSFDTVDGSILEGKMWTVMLCIHFFGWTTQFVGHGCYERRAPAIFTNFFFLFIAPFFVSLEMLKTCGYRKEEIRSLTKEVEADIAFYRLSKGYPMRKGICVKDKDY